MGGVRPGEIWTCHGGLEVLKVWGDGGMGGGAMIWCFFWYGGGGWYKLRVCSLSGGLEVAEVP